LLLEAGWSRAAQPFVWTRDNATDNLGFVVSPNDIGILELSRGFTYNAAATYQEAPDGRQDRRYAERFALSYVTGAHAFKSGIQVQQGSMSQGTVANHDIAYRFFNGAPSQIQQHATPYRQENTIHEVGVFVQDRWTRDRLAINMGLRLDYFSGRVPAQHVDATPSGWIPERNFAAVEDVPRWTDISPRLGASYDLFGTGRTAVKASVGRYVGAMGTIVTQANNPMLTSVNSVTRTWIDGDADFVPDCNLGNFDQNGECGPISDQNFGKNNPLATRYDPDLMQGFGRRSYHWDFITEVQQQLGVSWSLTAGYNRYWTDDPVSLTLGLLAASPIGWNGGITDNLAVGPGDFDHFCITAPVDTRLPGGGGYPVCGLYDVSPAKFGQINNVVNRHQNFGERRRNSDFVNLGVSSRFNSNLFINASLDAGRIVEDNCIVVDSPQAELYCRVVSPVKANTLVKLNGSYTFPADFIVSGVFQNVPGTVYGATYNATNAEVVSSLGRNLAACGTRVVCTATVAVPLIAPQTDFASRRTQVDLKFSKRFAIAGGRRLQADVSIYNVFNASDVLYPNATYGPAWRRPVNTGNGGSGFVDGRLVQVGGRFTW
jgi:hypothetical protein